MSFLDEEFNDPYYPPVNAPVRDLWGRFVEGPDYQYDYVSQYKEPTAREEDVWYFNGDFTQTEHRGLPYKIATTTAKSSAYHDEDEEEYNMMFPRTQNADMKKFTNSFKEIKIAPPPKSILDIVKEGNVEASAAMEETPSVSAPAAHPSSNVPRNTRKYNPASWTDRSEGDFAVWTPELCAYQQHADDPVQPGCRAPQRNEIDTNIEKSMRKKILANVPEVPGLEDGPIIVKVGNPRVTNTILMQAALRKLGLLINNALRNDTFKDPPNLLPRPSPIEHFEIDGFSILQNPDQNIKRWFELIPQKKFSKPGVEKILERCLLLLLAQVGFRVVKKRAIALLLDTAMVYLEKLAADLASKMTKAQSRKDIMELFLRDHYTNIEKLNDLYLKHTVRYEETVYDAYVKHYNMYLNMIETKKQKEEAERREEAGLLFDEFSKMIPELHVPDRPEGYEDVPDLAPGMQILQTLEQEAAALQLEDPMNPSAGIPIPLLEISENLSGLSSLQSISYGAAGGSAPLFSGFTTSSMFDIPETPGPSFLSTSYPTSETGLPDFATSPATSTATVSSSPGTPASVGQNKRRKL